MFRSQINDKEYEGYRIFHTLVLFCGASFACSPGSHSGVSDYVTVQYLTQ